MDLKELKIRLGINENDNSQDTVLQVKLDDAIDYAKNYCNNLFINSKGEMELPGAVKKGVALMVKSMGENSNVASQSLGDMSKSFFQNGTTDEAHKYFKPFRKLRFS